MSDLDKMIAEGATPEEIYKEAKRKYDLKRKAEQKQRDKEVEQARDRMIEEICKYFEVLFGEELELTKEDRKMIGKEVKRLEKTLLNDADGYLDLFGYKLF